MGCPAPPVPFLVSPDLRPFVDRLFTEPLRIADLADFFEYSPRRIPSLMQFLGAQRVGQRWRVPLLAMPPKYLVGAKLLASVEDVELAVQYVGLAEARQNPDKSNR